MILFLLFLLFLSNFSFVFSEEQCFPNIWAYRDTQSLLPSIHPFCLLKQTSEILETVNVIETAEEMEAFIQLNHLENERNEDYKIDYKGILRYSDGAPFLVPLKTFSPKCVGEVTVEISKNIATSCLIPWLNFNQSYCTENALINARRIFDQNLTFGQDTLLNQSTLIMSFENLLEPTWNARENLCENVLTKSVLQVELNRKNEIISATLKSLRYAKVNDENYESISISFEVNFVKTLFPIQTIQPTNDEFSDGEMLWSKNEHGDTVPWILYDVSGCYHSTERVVNFKRELSVGCEIRESSCEMLEQITSSLLQTLPSNLLISPKSTESIPVIRRNQTVEINTGGSDFRCFLPSIISVDVAYAKVGTKENNSIKIVGAYVNVQTMQIDLETTPKFFVIRRVNFRDVTKPASYHFAAIPKIDLRLPSDFFYPLIRNSENGRRISFFIINRNLKKKYLKGHQFGLNNIEGSKKQRCYGRLAATSQLSVW
ncbi:unnamed protein product, partial [Mesorhabditis belari]|uniref:Tectonic domain-containing protein n=1 Tax=Mesorhabditis belari TaxID=2138241 RepID=A0AAF3FKI9_9BILA